METVVDLRSSRLFYELNSWKDDSELLESARACVEFQKAAGVKMFEKYFKPNASALDEVSKEMLDRNIKEGSDASDLRVDRRLSNCIVFNSRNMEGSVLDEQLVTLRNKTNQLVRDRIGRIFGKSHSFSIQESGHFWYPPGGFMKWHTNVRTPGWRLYVSFAEEPGKSFFRYRDPETKEIITAWDEGWNFRLFRIDPRRFFWHAVYSNTNRFSLGYRILASPRVNLVKRVARKLEAIFS